MNAIMRRLRFWLRYQGEKPPWDSGVTPPELTAFVESHPAGRVLDLGCGTGTNVIYLAEHGWDATGIDFIGKAIRSGRRKARRAGVDVRLRVGDVTNLDGYTQLYDLILDIGCFHALTPEGRARYGEHIQRLLSPKGTYMLYAFIKPEGQVGTGITEQDLEVFAPKLTLTRQESGTDHGERVSAWHWFKKSA